MVKVIVNNIKSVFIILTLFSVSFSQNFSEEYKNKNYDYKNYVVTFENFKRPLKGFVLMNPSIIPSST